MHAIDTNVLVRLLVGDEAVQAAKAEAFVADGAWVSHLVLAEVAWVLDSVYNRTGKQIGDLVEMLLQHRNLTLQEADVVSAALDRLRSATGTRGASFPDCLILEIARKAGHLPLGTFDRRLGRIEGAARL